MREAVQLYFNGERHEALDFQRCQSGCVDKDLDLDVGQVGKGVYTHRAQCPQAAPEEREPQDKDGATAGDRPGDEFLDHRAP